MFNIMPVTTASEKKKERKNRRTLKTMFGSVFQVGLENCTKVKVL